jgi:GAF domain-containing protein
LGLSTVGRYTVGGFLFGLMFPLGATTIDLFISGLPLTLENALAVQASQTLHLLIDTAPLLLAAAGWLAGVRQQHTEATSAKMEGRVAGRTAELAANTARLQAVIEVSSFVTRARDLDNLLRDVVNLIVEKFDFYHAQVFLLADEGRYAVLQASTGDAGRELLERGHRLEVASSSVIGHVTKRGEPLIALASDTDTIHRHNELLLDTQAEMALPLKIGDRVLGALDVQSVQSNAFTPDDIPVFQAMADQLAIAIENVRLLEEAQQNLNDIEALNRQLTGEAWRDYLAGRAATEPQGYRADERGVHAVDHPPSADEEAAEDVTSLPIVVRGQTIGLLDVESSEGETLDEDTQAILEAVAERVALALDNTRLAQQAQRTAQIQQMVNVFSEKLQRAPDIRSILRLVATEVGGVLGAPRSFAQLETRGDTGATSDSSE